MVANLVRKDHLTFTSGSDMLEICKPLEKLGITAFNYVRTHDDASQINLSNIPAWLEHFYENEFYLIGAFERHPSKYKAGYAFWPQLSGQEIFLHAREYFNIDNGITIIEKNTDSCDFYYFASQENNTSIINFYLNHIDLLERFILYFKDRAGKLIKRANENRIILPGRFERHKSSDANEKYLIEFSKADFIRETSIKSIKLTGELCGEILSTKQLDCLLQLTEGKTAKEIARMLGISYRTVEGHITKMKMRFGCQTKAELISKLMKSGLDKYSAFLTE